MSELSWLIKPVVILGGIEREIVPGAQSINDCSRKRIQKVHKYMPTARSARQAEIKGAEPSLFSSHKYSYGNAIGFPGADPR